MYNISFDIDFKRNIYPGKLIVLEGIDGSGKTTQAENLVQMFTKEDKEVVYTKEPTDGVIGKMIRDILAGKMQVTPVAFQYLFVADRAVHQEEIIELLKAGKTIISDRYFWSAIAYGISDREAVDYDNTGKFLLVAQSVLSFYNQFIIPDRTLYLDISVEKACERLSSMDREKEIYEKKDKLVKIEKGYRWLLKEFAKEFTVVNGEQSVEEITREIVSSI